MPLALCKRRFWYSLVSITNKYNHYAYLVIGIDCVIAWIQPCDITVSSNYREKTDKSSQTLFS